jgi:hypothetical protein
VQARLGRLSRAQFASQLDAARFQGFPLLLKRGRPETARDCELTRVFH